MKKKNWINADALTTLARVLVAIYSIVNLIFSNRHISALLKLQNEICGFYMFVFVLAGLMMLFEATRMKSMNWGVLIRGFAVSALVILMGGLLLAIYQEGRILDTTIDESVLIQSERVIWIVIIMAAVAFCAEIAAFVLERRGRKQNEEAPVI